MHPCQVLTADIRAQVGFVKAFSAEDISRRPLAMTPSESMKGWLKMSWRLTLIYVRPIDISARATES